MSIALMKKTIKRYINYWRLIRSKNDIVNLNKIDFFSSVDGCVFAVGVSSSKGSSIMKSKVGRYTSIGRNTKVSHAVIGSFCAISWDCTINAIAHPVDRLTVSAFPYVPDVGGFVKEREQFYKKVVIGNDVWIGAQSIIMPGVTIGDGAIIGAGSIVTKNVNPYEIVAGNPAKHLRWRFDETVISELNQVKWWDWSDNKIQQNITLFHEAITKDFLDKVKSA